MRALPFTLLCLSCASAPAAEPTQPVPRPEQTSPTPQAARPADSNAANISQSLEQASVQGARLQARTIQQAAEIWRTSHPSGCPTADDLVRDHQLMNERATVDPWGSRYVVSCKGDRIEVRSPGPDRSPGTGDDVSNDAGP
jgi:hypothetical protein